MGDGRGRITLHPLGTSPLLRLAAPPAWHHTRQAYDWMAEMVRGPGAGSFTSWSWLVRVRATGVYVELPMNLRATRSVPQHKVSAALAGIA